MYKENHNIAIAKDQICAITTDKIDTCYGDGGGSLMSFIEGRFYIEGIVSFGPTMCGTMPSIYTSVSNYKNWILNNMKPWANYKYVWFKM